MPIYEYQCSACGHRLEVIQKMSDAPLEMCDNCSQPALRKLVSAAGFRLKGTGWYVTDFKDKGKPKPASAKESDGGEKSGKEKTQTEQKKETTSASKSDAGVSSTSTSSTGAG